MTQEKIINYYNSKLHEFGLTPRGVDWKDEKGQVLRFDKLISAVGLHSCKGRASLLDFGCGHGELGQYLGSKNLPIDYFGYDISTEMIKVASGRADIISDAEFSAVLPEGKKWDYTIASGVFNVKLDQSPDDWKSYIFDTILQLKKVTRESLALNFLTTFSDIERRSAKLYYASPRDIFDFCASQIGRDITIFHHYNIYEFTIGVRIEGEYE